MSLVITILDNYYNNLGQNKCTYIVQYHRRSFCGSILSLVSISFFLVSRFVVMFDDAIGTKENKHLTKAKSQPQLFGVTWSKVDIFNVLSVSLWKRSLNERRTMSTQIKNNYLALRLSTRILWNSLGEFRCILNHVDYKFRNKSRLYKLPCKWLVKIN